MKKLGGLMMILDLHRHRVKIAAIARKSASTVKQSANTLAGASRYAPTVLVNLGIACLIHTCLIHAWITCKRVWMPPGLRAQQLAREQGERGYTGGYSTASAVRPSIYKRKATFGDVEVSGATACGRSRNRTAS